MRKYIVLVSGSIGGAEKRFFDIFRGLLQIDQKVFLVLPSCLFDIISQEEDLSNYLDNIIILDIPVWSPLIFIKKYFNEVLKRSNKNDFFHYPLSPLFFLHLLVKRKYSISFCDCHYLPRLSLKNMNASLQWLASFFSAKIDILSPSILKLACEKHPHIKRKASLTPGGTYIYPSSVTDVKKKRKFVFISRLEPDKGVDVLFEILPLINTLFLGKEKVSFQIYGDGSLKGYVEQEVKVSQLNGIDVEFNGYGVVNDALSDVWCVFSLQDITNYPSRVVAEALLQGAEVLILDTGNSRDFGEGAGLNYVARNYSDLPDVIQDINMRASYKNMGTIESIKASAAAQFSSQKYLKYILSLLKV